MSVVVVTSVDGCALEVMTKRIYAHAVLKDVRGAVSLSKRALRSVENAKGGTSSITNYSLLMEKLSTIENMSDRIMLILQDTGVAVMDDGKMEAVVDSILGDIGPAAKDKISSLQRLTTNYGNGRVLSAWANATEHRRTFVQHSFFLCSIEKRMRRCLHDLERCLHHRQQREDGTSRSSSPVTTQKAHAAPARAPAPAPAPAPVPVVENPKLKKSRAFLHHLTIPRFSSSKKRSGGGGAGGGKGGGGAAGLRVETKEQHEDEEDDRRGSLEFESESEVQPTLKPGSRSSSRAGSSPTAAAGEKRWRVATTSIIGDGSNVPKTKSKTSTLVTTPYPTPTPTPTANTGSFAGVQTPHLQSISPSSSSSSSSSLGFSHPQEQLLLLEHVKLLLRIFNLKQNIIRMNSEKYANQEILKALLVLQEARRIFKAAKKRSFASSSSHFVHARARDLVKSRKEKEEEQEEEKEEGDRIADIETSHVLPSEARLLKVMNKYADIQGREQVADVDIRVLSDEDLEILIASYRDSSEIAIIDLVRDDWEDLRTDNHAFHLLPCEYMCDYEDLHRMLDDQFRTYSRDGAALQGFHETLTLLSKLRSANSEDPASSSSSSFLCLHKAFELWKRSGGGDLSPEALKKAINDLCADR